MVGLKEIEDARERIGDAVFTSPCARSETFSKLLGAKCYFKLENLQMTGSFKERGALNKLLSLGPEDRARGVVAASAGNHAQGVAYHAGRLGIPATIVMPDRTPLIKLKNTQDFGATVVLAGGNFDEALAQAHRIEEREKLAFVHPFDDDHVIAGQGTIGLELLEQNPYLEVVLVPIGGGGLISGIATALKEVNPRIRVIGVETEVLPSMKRSVEAGQPVTLPPATTIADGIAIKRPSERTLAHVLKYVDDIVTVGEEEIANAILLLLEREKTVVEGAGATTLAALANGRVPSAAGRKTVMVLSGGNIDVTMISRIIQRGLAKDGRLVRLSVEIEDRPGGLARLTATLAAQAANVIEIHHDRAFGTSRPSTTEIEVTLETRGRDHIDQLIAALQQQGYVVREERWGGSSLTGSSAGG